MAESLNEKSKCCFTHNVERPGLYPDLVKACQFTNETKFSDIDGKRYCRFHFPLKDMHGQDTVKMSWSEAERSQFRTSIYEILSDSFFKKNIAHLMGVQFPEAFELQEWVDYLESYKNWSGIGKQHFPRLIVRGAIFGGPVNFSNAQFQDGTDFTHAVFMDDASFSDSQFGENVKFTHAIFYKVAGFMRAEFGHACDFSDANFRGEWTNFIDSKFDGFANFDGAKFIGNVSYSTKFEGPAFHMISFNGVQFGDKNGPHSKPLLIDFTNRSFEQAATFDGAIFHYAPLFHNANVHQGCIIDAAEYLDVNTSVAPSAYRTLKLAMEEKRNWNGMAKFHALEERSARYQRKLLDPIRIVSAAYDWASEYGQSFMRPLVGLVGVWVFGAFFMLVIGGMLDPAYGEGWARDAGVFALKQMVRPFDAFIAPAEDWGLWINSEAVITEAVRWMRVVAMLQTLATAGFVTLFILAVRRRFRMA